VNPSKYQTHTTALALPFDAPSATIKIAYNSLDEKYNPTNSHYDKHKPEAMEKIAARHAQVKQAYEVLNDKPRRKAYVAFVKALPRDWRPTYDSGRYSSSTLLGISLSVVVVLLTAFSGLELAAFTQERNDILKSKAFLKAQSKASAAGKSNENFLAEYISTEKPELEYGASDTVLARLILWPFKLVGIVSSKQSSADVVAKAAAAKEQKKEEERQAFKQQKEQRSRDKRAAAKAQQTARAEAQLKTDRDRRREDRVKGLIPQNLQVLAESGLLADMLPDVVADSTAEQQKDAWVSLYKKAASSVDWTRFDETLEVFEEMARQERQALIDAEQEVCVWGVCVCTNKMNIEN
jgi:hypothetical protein